MTTVVRGLNELDYLEDHRGSVTRIVELALNQG